MADASTWSPTRPVVGSGRAVSTCSGRAASTCSGSAASTCSGRATPTHAAGALRSHAAGAPRPGPAHSGGHYDNLRCAVRVRPAAARLNRGFLCGARPLRSPGHGAAGRGRTVGGGRPTRSSDVYPSGVRGRDEEMLGLYCWRRRHARRPLHLGEVWAPGLLSPADERRTLWNCYQILFGKGKQNVKGYR